MITIHNQTQLFGTYVCSNIQKCVYNNPICYQWVISVLPPSILSYIENQCIHQWITTVSTASFFQDWINVWVLSYNRWLMLYLASSMCLWGLYTFNYLTPKYIPTQQYSLDHENRIWDYHLHNTLSTVLTLSVFLSFYAFGLLLGFDEKHSSTDGSDWVYIACWVHNLILYQCFIILGKLFYQEFLLYSHECKCLEKQKKE